MGLFSRKKETPAPVQEERAVNLGGLTFGGLYGYGNSQAMSLDAFYCGVHQISNSVARLPINVYKIEGERKIKLSNHQLQNILNVSPDGVHSHFNFFKIMVESLILKGNAYALIERDEQLNVKSLKYVNADWVTPMIQPDGSVKYIVNGISQAIDAVNMIHLYLHLDDNFRGISVLRYAFNSMKGIKAAEDQATSFFESGQNVSGIINASATLTNDQKQQIRDSWNSAFNSTNKSGIAVLPAGLSYTQISVDPKDGQLLESRQFNVNTIARWLCIPPSKLFDMEGVSYNGMEYAQLEYLQDTIGPYVNLIQDEFNRKLFKPSQIGKVQISLDFAALMSTNKDVEANYYKQMIVNSIMTINEVRDKLNLEPIENGDKPIMQLSYTTLDNIVNGTLVKGQTQQQLQPADQLDNKVKGNKQDKQDKE